MRRVALLLFVALLAGCGASSSRLVGTWVGEMKPSSSKSLESGLESMASQLMGALTLEFNDRGKYKISASLGTVGSGDYAVHGNTVTLTPDNGKKPMDMEIDGDTLRMKKDFPSDPDLVMTRQPG